MLDNYLNADAATLLKRLPDEHTRAWAWWLITSCRSANNIMPITVFLPAFIASFFYSA